MEMLTWRAMGLVDIPPRHWQPLPFKLRNEGW